MRAALLRLVSRRGEFDALLESSLDWLFDCLVGEEELDRREILGNSYLQSDALSGGEIGTFGERGIIDGEFVIAFSQIVEIEGAVGIRGGVAI